MTHPGAPTLDDSDAETSWQAFAELAGRAESAPAILSSLVAETLGEIFRELDEAPQTVKAMMAAVGVEDLHGACLRGASLRGEDLSGIGFAGADFTGADLRDCDFRGCDLVLANFTNAQLSGARFDDALLDEATHDFLVDAQRSAEPALVAGKGIGAALVIGGLALAGAVWRRRARSGAAARAGPSGADGEVLATDAEPLP